MAVTAAAGFLAHAQSSIQTRSRGSGQPGEGWCLDGMDAFIYAPRPRACADRAAAEIGADGYARQCRVLRERPAGACSFLGWGLSMVWGADR